MPQDKQTLPFPGSLKPHQMLIEVSLYESGVYWLQIIFKSKK
jgi:hypothetical protein